MLSETDRRQAARQSALQLAERLAQRQTDRVVFAESCTSGLVAALLGQVPGISNWLCGSAVTYRESVKTDWLGVRSETLKQHSAESVETTSAMAIGILQRTEEANFSAAVTGHLGPDAPPDLDGKVFVAIARRIRDSIRGDSIEIATATTIPLESSTRVARQFEAAKSVLDLLNSQLSSASSGPTRQ